jgi:hypothetical protein
MAFRQIKLNGTSYDICTKYIYATSYSSTFYPVGITVGSGLTATAYYNSSVSIRNGNSVYASGGFYESSDERLKNLLTPVEVSLEKLSQLRKIYYTWKEGDDKKRHIGLVAQDVQKIYPELVEEDEETGNLSMSYDKVSVLALAAIDVLYKENKELKDRLFKLEQILSSKGIL